MLPPPGVVWVAYPHGMREDMIVVVWRAQQRTWISYARNVWKAMARLSPATQGDAELVCHVPATRAEVSKVQWLLKERHIDDNWYQGVMDEAEVERMLDRARRHINAPSKGDVVRLKDVVWEAERIVDTAKDDDIAREWYLKAKAALDAFSHVMVEDHQVRRHTQLLERLEEAGRRRAGR